MRWPFKPSDDHGDADADHKRSACADRAFSAGSPDCVLSRRCKYSVLGMKILPGCVVPILSLLALVTAGSRVKRLRGSFCALFLMHATRGSSRRCCHFHCGA
ncbi:hypothetical protein BJX64DRAFT_174149 [Aspergillus heterothallicus]